MKWDRHGSLVQTILYLAHFQCSGWYNIVVSCKLLYSLRERLRAGRYVESTLTSTFRDSHVLEKDTHSRMMLMSLATIFKFICVNFWLPIHVCT